MVACRGRLTAKLYWQTTAPDLSFRAIPIDSTNIRARWPLQTASCLKYTEKGARMLSCAKLTLIGICYSNSVCLSVTLVHCVEMAKYIVTFSTIQYSPSFEFSHNKHFGKILTRWAMKDTRFSTNVWLCFGNDARDGYNYCRTLIASQTWPINGLVLVLSLYLLFYL